MALPDAGARGGGHGDGGARCRRRRWTRTSSRRTTLRKYIAYAKQNCHPKLQNADYDKIAQVGGPLSHHIPESSTTDMLITNALRNA